MRRLCNISPISWYGGTAEVFDFIMHIDIAQFYQTDLIKLSARSKILEIASSNDPIVSPTAPSEESYQDLIV